MMSRVVLVGAGVVAERKHLPALRGLTDLWQVTGVVDPDSQRLRLLSDLLPGARTFETLGLCLDSMDFEAVAVLTPPGSHVALTEEALAAGKFVLVEKPLSLSLEEARRLQAHPASARVVMGFHMRHHRLVLQARQQLRSGQLGQIQACRGAWCAPRPPDQSEWENLRALGGGALIELAVHYYDLLRFLFEQDLEPVEARALSAERDDEGACVLGRTTGGIPFSGVFSERASHQLEFEFYGSRGRLKLDCLRFDGLRFSGWGVDTGAVPFRLREFLQTLSRLPEGLRSFRSGGDYLGSYREQWRHFAQVVAGRTSPLCRVEDGVAALEAALSSLVNAGQSGYDQGSLGVARGLCQGR